MRQKNRLTILGICLCAAMMAVAACGGETDRAQSQEATVTVQEIVNLVEVNALHPEAKELAFVKLQLGQFLHTGNLVKTHENSTARIDISIQNFTRVSRTAPETVWQLGRFALNGDAVIELQEGKIFVFDEDNGQENWPLHIETPAGTASARGTWMAVEFDPKSGTVQVECLRGICELENDLGYQVFTNEQTVVATAVSVPSEPVPMDRVQIEAFHDLPEVVTQEMPIPARFAPVEARAKLEKARTLAVERQVMIDERKINSALASELINARAREEDAATGSDSLRERTNRLEQKTTNRETSVSEIALTELGEVRANFPERLADTHATAIEDLATAQSSGLGSVAGATDERVEIEAGAIEELAQAEAIAIEKQAKAEATPTEGQAKAVPDTQTLNDGTLTEADPIAAEERAEEQALTGEELDSSAVMAAEEPDEANAGTAASTPDSTLVATGDTVTAVRNAAPVALNDTATTDQDMAVKVSVLGNDSDADGDKMSVTNLTQPPNGAITLSPDNTILYTPGSGFTGVESFTYQANDGTDDSNIATVTVTVVAVNAVPVAVDDTASTMENVGVTIDVLQNDSDADGDALTVTNLTQPSNGTATVNPDNTIDFTPNPGFIGVVSFTYRAKDGMDQSGDAAVTVTVVQPLSADVTGAWSTDYGTMLLEQLSATVTGTYTYNGGVILEASISGRTLTGYWVEDSSSMDCGSKKDDRNNWGRISFDFNEDFTSFTGKWGLCDQVPKKKWNGSR